MKVRKGPARAALLSTLVTAALTTIAVSPASAAATPPYEPDSGAAGSISFYDTAGNLLTSGSTSTQIGYAVGSTTLTATGSKASLYGYLPVSGQAPGAFSGELLAGPTTFPVSGAPGGSTNPSVKPVAGDLTFADLAKDFPNKATDAYAGLYQIRIKTTDAKYLATDISISNGTWSQVYPAAAATAPAAPRIGTATAGNGSASVTFSAPASDGGSAITGYTVTSTPGGITATGTGSPIRVTGLTNGTAYTFTVHATNSVGSGAESASSNSVTPSATQSAEPAFHALSPARLLDTRLGVGASRAPIGPNGSLALQVTGAGGVPSSGVGAVVLNVTVTSPTSVGYVTAYPSDATRPTASNLNYVKGQTVPNLVVVPVSSSGQITLFNGGNGSANLIADVAGYFDGGSPTKPGSFGALTPARLLDTRNGSGAPRAAVPPNGTLTLAVAGQGGVPASGVGAVVLNVTVTAPSSVGYVTAYPSGTSRPTASNLNYVAGQTVPNLVVVPLGADGSISLFNGSSGSTQLVADVAGYFLAGTPTTSGAFGAVTPARLLDTRTGLGAPRAAVGPNGEVVLTINGQGGVPSSGVAAVVLNVTITSPTTAGYITAYPSGTSRPTASNLNYVKGQTVPNLVVVPVGADGTVRLFNGSNGSVHLIADVAGYLTS